MENPHTGKFNGEQYKADLRDQMKEREMNALNAKQLQQQSFNNAARDYALRERAALAEKDFHSKELRRKC